MTLPTLLRSMRHPFRLATIAAALLATTAGLTAQEVTLRFGHHWSPDSPDGHVIAAALEEFAEQFPNVTVVPEVMGHDEYLAQFKIGAASGALVDVFAINRADVEPSARAGLLRELDTAMETNAAWGDALIDALVLEGTIDDTVYAVPAFQLITHVIYHNAAMMAEAGFEEFPKTWDELLVAVDALKAMGVTPIALGNRAAWVAADPLFGTLAFRATGSEWYDRLLAREAEFTDAEFVRALALFKELSDRGAFNANANSIDNDQQKSLFLNKEAAMFIEGNWAIQPIMTGASPELLANVRMGYWPTTPGGVGPGNQVSGGAGWLWAASANLEGDAAIAAEGLIAALTGETAGRARLANGLMPSSTLASTEGIDMPPMLGELGERVSTGEIELVPIFVTALPGAILDKLGRGLQDLMTGATTPEDLAARLQDEYDRTL